MLKEGESVDDSALEDRKKGLKPSNCCILVYTVRRELEEEKIIYNINCIYS